MYAVSLKGVSKSYRIYPHQRDRLKEALSFGRIRRGHDFWALKDIDLEVERGTTLGVVGRNGAGKSTLLQVVSGVLQPTSGSVRICSQPVLLQMGAGFNPEFTGRENVMLNGLLLGIERRKILERFDEIEAFADIGEFMDQQVKTYSSGMRARLGFAVAVNVEPDILIVDETLSVGDAVFKHMGLQKMRELRDRGTTILFVSHSMRMVRNFCTEAALLHKGRLMYHGEIAETLDRYQALISSVGAKQNPRQQDSEQPPNYDIEYMDEEEDEMVASASKEKAEPDHRSPSLRHGTGEARISRVEVLDEGGFATEVLSFDSRATIRVHVEYLKDVEGSILTIILRNKAGLDVFSTDTNREKQRLGNRVQGERVIADFSLNMPLQHGAYSVTAAISPSTNKKIYLDRLDVAAVFKVLAPEGRGTIPGLFHIPTTVEIHSPGRKGHDRSD